MPIAELENTRISYLDEGQGDTVLLVHGFASNIAMNWSGPGWVSALLDAGYRVIALDNRGHGGSTKYYGEEDYHLDRMASDAVGLLDYLNISEAHVIGYSMGARITCTMAINAPERCRKLVLGGNGSGMVEGSGDWEPVRQALLAQDTGSITDARGKAFRVFADKTGGDLKALAACVIGVRQLIDRDALAGIKNDTLIAIGSLDDIAGSGQKLADMMQNAAYLEIPKRDHMRSVGDKVFIQGALDFLAN